MTALLVAGSTKLFKALLNGGGVDQKDTAEIAGAMFEALLKVQNQGESLARVEAKLDRSLQQDFDRSYRLGAYLLRDASHHEFDARAQETALRSARERFLEAVAGTSNRGQRVQALHAAAGCSLLAGRPTTARAELDEAWREAFDIVKTNALRLGSPATGANPKNLGEYIFGPSAQKRRAWADMEAEVDPLRPILSDIQTMRQALGAPDRECPLLLFPVGNTIQRPLRILACCPQVNLPDGSSISVRASQLPGAKGGTLQAEAEVSWARDERPVATINAAIDLQDEWLLLDGNQVWRGWKTEDLGRSRIQIDKTHTIESSLPPNRPHMPLKRSADMVVVELFDLTDPPQPFILVGFGIDALNGKVRPTPAS